MKYDRVDENQSEIVQALEQVGASVVSLSMVKYGCPDLCVGFRNVNYLLEVKTERGTLTPAQKKFFSKWNGLAIVVKTVEEALAAIGAI
jgi:Holliday junction resolvase